MRLFDDVETDPDDKTFDPNTLNRKISVKAMLDVDFLHESSEDEVLEEVRKFVDHLKSNTEPTP